VLLFVLLTFFTGSVDAVSYLGLDRVFTTNMTGNLALFKQSRSTVVVDHHKHASTSEYAVLSVRTPCVSFR